MKYRYPLKPILLPALLFSLCLAMTLISMVVWSLMATTNETPEGYTVTAEAVIPALLMIATWIGTAILAGRLRFKVLLWFDTAFWASELLIYLLCLTPLYATGAKLFLTVTSLPLWSFFALVELMAVQSTAATAIVTAFPMLLMLGVFVWQLKKISRSEKSKK